MSRSSVERVDAPGVFLFRVCAAGSGAVGARESRPHVIVARHYVVSGRVQGVGFRYFVEDAALREGVSGYVRNLPDGRVEAVVEGDLDAVVRLEQALWNGPPGARVDDVVVEAATPTGRASGFRIRA